MGALLTCEVCGEDFERTGTRGPIPFACGSTCRGRAFRRRQGMAERVFYTRDEYERRQREQQRARRGSAVEDRTRLPSRPFGQWCARRALQTEGGLSALAKSYGVDAAQLRRIVKGAQRTVPLDLVDRALLNTETGLWELYPELYEREELAV